MGSHEITKILNLKNLTDARITPSSSTHQGVQAFTTVFLGLFTSFVRSRNSKSPRLSSAFAPALALAIAALGISLFSQTAYAASYINVSSGSGGTVSLGSIKPSSTGVSASGSDTLTITTNCSAGYSVYVSAQNGGDTNLTNTNSSVTSNNTISASSTAVGSTATTLNSNTWGITGDSASASASKYVGLPSYADAMNAALITTTTASTSSANTNTIYYGAKVDTSLAPGTYSGDVLYTTLITEACNNYTVKFDANGGTGTMQDQSIPVGEATSLTLNSFTRSGYMFLGWGTSSSATTPTYKDGEKVTDISDFNTTIILYALWGQSTGTMQDTKCSSLAAGATTYLTDSRDNQVYSVYRIPTDQTYAGSSTIANIAGKCLMTKDLSLGYVTGGSITKGSNLVLSTDTSAGSTTSSAPVVFVDAVNSGTGWSGTNSDDNLQYTNGPRIGHEGYSNHSYYTFGAAQKVCPKGWRLPDTEEYGTNSSSDAATVGLAAIVGNSAIGSKTLQASPWNFILGGGFGTSGWYNQGSYGDYRSSTQGSATYGYYLSFGSSGVYRYNSYKNSGRSVRCISQNNYTVNYNTNGASGSASKSTDGTQYESASITTATVGSMTKTGYHFLGWSTNSSATSATYSAGANVSVSTLASAASASDGGTITLYAVWAKNTFTVNYSANGGTGSASKTSETATYNTNVTMPTKNTLAKSGYDFLGWSLSSSATSATWTANTGVAPTSLKSNVTTVNGGSVTVYAVWQSSVQDCSSTVHPGTLDTAGCKMKDGNIWVYGNGKGTLTWDKVSNSKCPSGYSVPSKTIIESLISAQGSGSEISSALGLTSSGVTFWTSTQYDSDLAYALTVYNGYVIFNGNWNKTHSLYLLCYKKS